MATETRTQQLRAILDNLSSVNDEKLKRTELGVRSLAQDLEPREAKIRQLKDLALSYSHLVHDSVVDSIIQSFSNIFNLMGGQADLDDSNYISQREQFLANIDAYLEEANLWKGSVASAAMFERGFLDDEDFRRETRQSLEDIKQESSATIQTIKAEADKSIQEAKKSAREIEEGARRTATGVSVKAAQDQFSNASIDDNRQVKIWSILVVISVSALIGTTLLLTRWKLPESSEWPVALYHTLLRMIILSSIAGITAFAFRMLRARLHIAERNKHRVRVANSVEGFVQSALEPSQRDLILAKLTDAIVNFGESGLVQHQIEDRSSTMPGDLMGRIVAAISNRGTS